jgi:hypothetical protein
MFRNKPFVSRTLGRRPLGVRSPAIRRREGPLKGLTGAGSWGSGARTGRSASKMLVMFLRNAKVTKTPGVGNTRMASV